MKNLPRSRTVLKLTADQVMVFFIELQAQVFQNPAKNKELYFKSWLNLYISSSHDSGGGGGGGSSSSSDTGGCSGGGGGGGGSMGDGS